MPSNSDIVVHGFKVNGTVYKYDYNHLENKPEAELPAAESADRGKVLTVGATGSPEWATFEALTTDLSAGLILAVNDYGESQWMPPSDAGIRSVPTSAVADSGKVLTVDASGLPEWSTPSSGGGGGALPASGTNASGVNILIPSGASDFVWADMVNTLTSALPSAPNWISDNHLDASSGAHNPFMPTLGRNSSDEWSWGYAIRRFPDQYAGYVANDDYVLTDSGWRSLQNLEYLQLSHSSEDSGLVLMVDEYGELTWSSEFPTFSANNNSGDVLMVNEYGGLIWSGVFPTFSAVNDSGAVLTVDAWGELSWYKVFPDYDYNDFGKVLGVDAQGDLEWRSISSGGGGGLPAFGEEITLSLSGSGSGSGSNSGSGSGSGSGSIIRGQVLSIASSGCNKAHVTWCGRALPGYSGLEYHRTVIQDPYNSNGTGPQGLSWNGYALPIPGNYQDGTIPVIVDCNWSYMSIADAISNYGSN